MRVLLGAATLAFPTHGGENKSNRLLLEALARRGHHVRLVSPALGRQGHGERDALLRDLEEHGARPASVPPSAAPSRLSWTWNGVQVDAPLPGYPVHRALADQLREDRPDVVLVSSQDPGQVLLEAASESGVPLVFLAHTLAFLPFGPLAYRRDARGHELMRRCSSVVTVSAFARGYLRDHGGIEATVMAFPIEGGPVEAGAHDAIGMFNPCVQKGVEIFAAVAARMPHRRFLAVEGWGTTAADRARLPGNVERWRPRTKVHEIFRELRLLLVPSLVPETFGLVAVEAMLAGVLPVVSDAGGLPEAALGVAPIVPVRGLAGHGALVDDAGLPVGVAPPQDVDPWVSTVERALVDDAALDERRRRARAAAERFAAAASVLEFEALLERAIAGAERRAPAARAPARADGGAPPAATDERIRALSPDRRAALAALLAQQRRSASVEPPRDRPGPEPLAAAATRAPLPALMAESEEHEEPLEGLIARGVIAPVDAVAVAAMPAEWLPRSHPMRARVLQRMDGRPMLFEVAEGRFGRVGLLVLPLFTDEVFRERERLAAALKAAFELSVRVGARALSMFHPLALVTDFGRALPTPPPSLRVTTGHGTVGAAVLLTARALWERVGRVDDRLHVVGLHPLAAAIVGAIAASFPGKDLVLCDIPERQKAVQELASALAERGHRGAIEVRLGSRIRAGAEPTTWLMMTHGPSLLDAETLPPGSLVIDDSLPLTMAAEEVLPRASDLLWTVAYRLGGAELRDKHVVATPGMPSPATMLVCDADTLPRCALSGLLAARDPRLVNIGPATAEQVLDAEEAALAAGAVAAPFGLSPWFSLPAGSEEAFRARHGSTRGAAR